MTDVRCPMCGKMNDGERETCQYCQARLKPVHISDDFEELDSLLPPEPSSSPKSKSEPLFPDWLSSLRESGQDESEQKGSDQQISEGDTGEFLKPDETSNLPSWILGNEESALVESDESWGDAQYELDQILSSAKTTAPQNEIEPVKGTTGDLPLGFEQEPDETDSDSSLPDWMLEFLSEKENHAQVEVSTPDIDISQPVSEKQSDESSVEFEKQDEATVPPLASVGIPQEKFEGLPLGEEELITATELPDWLDEISPDELSPESIEPAELEEGEKKITSAELPAWLTAVRSVSSVEAVSGEEKQSQTPTEGLGPLSGLAGVLSAEAAISVPKKAPSQLIKLQASESHLNQASILEKLIAAEGEARSIPPSISTTPLNIWRIVIGIVLISALLFAILSGMQQIISAESSPDAILLNQTINSLPAASKVVVAIDYQPASTGEMEAVFSPVLSHLSIKGASLTVVSTVPTGAIQIERLLSILDQKYNLLPVQTNVLGYIPGGVTGLAAFAQTPQRVLPYALDGSQPWIDGSLRDVLTISDFDLLVVVTDSSDIARGWIEQVQPRLEDKPLAMILSAQTEPLVRPYYEAKQKQVDVLVSGVAGGASYQAISGGLGLAIERLAPFKLGGAVAALIMLVGTVVSAISGIWARERAAAKGKAKA